MEQSDTPRTDLASAEGYFDKSLKWVPTGNSDQVVTALARALERELAAVTRERDEAQAEVERLRSVLLGHVPHVYEGNCPDRVDPTQRDSYCPACRILAATEPKP